MYGILLLKTVSTVDNTVIVALSMIIIKRGVASVTVNMYGILLLKTVSTVDNTVIVALSMIIIKRDAPIVILNLHGMRQTCPVNIVGQIAGIAKLNPNTNMKFGVTPVKGGIGIIINIVGTIVMRLITIVSIVWIVEQHARRVLLKTRSQCVLCV